MTRGSGYKGAKRVRAFAQVATGAIETSIGYRPMEISTTRKLENHDLALMELAETARAVIRDAGFDKQFPHVTGHGLGFRYHEPTPLICPGSDQVLDPGMVHTVEPGIYFPEMGGIRLEENVAVTENGCEVLGPFKKAL